AYRRKIASIIVGTTPRAKSYSIACKCSLPSASAARPQKSIEHPPAHVAKPHHREPTPIPAQRSALREGAPVARSLPSDPACSPTILIRKQFPIHSIRKTPFDPPWGQAWIVTQPQSCPRRWRDRLSFPTSNHQISPPPDSTTVEESTF